MLCMLLLTWECLFLFQLFKMDVEGFEADAIQGSMQVALCYCVIIALFRSCDAAASQPSGVQYSC